VEMLSNPDAYRNIYHANKSVAVLAMIYENKIAVDTALIQSLLNKALVNKVNSHDLSPICDQLDKATNSLSEAEAKKIFPKGLEFFKNLLDGCTDLEDLKMVTSRANRLGINMHRAINGNKEIRTAIQHVVEIESDSLLSRDYGINNCFEAVQVEKRILELQREIKVELLRIGIRYKGSFWNFENADCEGIASKNVEASDEAEDEYILNEPEDYDSDIDIDAVFKP
jgi:hypothetical protein